MGNRTLYVTRGEDCLQLQADGDAVNSTDVPELHSTQEEADTRMFLHAKHAADAGHDKVSYRRNTATYCMWTPLST